MMIYRRQKSCMAIQDAVSSENNKASHAGLPLPYNITAGDMNAALFKQDVQRVKFDTKDAKPQGYIRNMHLHTIAPDKQPHRHHTFRHTTVARTVAKTVESMTYSSKALAIQLISRVMICMCEGRHC